MIVTDERVALFVAKQCGVVINPPYTLMGIEHNEQIIAGVVFNHWTGFDIHMTAAGRGWTKGFIADVGEYLFAQLKVRRVTVITQQPKVVRMAERLGGQVEGLMRDHFGPGKDAFVVGILSKDWAY